MIATFFAPEVETMHCNQCGVEMVPGSAFCASCGQPASLVATESGSTTVTAAGMSANLAGALCYLGGFVTAIIFLVLDPYRRNGFVRFHAFQSIFFSVAWIALYVALGILESLLPWTLFRVVATLSIFVSLALFCVALWLMYRAYNKERFKLPILGDLAEKQV